MRGSQMRPGASQALTFLFTDIEGSTQLWERHTDAMRDALERHDAILRGSVEGSNGRVVKTTGDGLMAVFTSTADGIRASLGAQEGLKGESWGETGPLSVRMALHVGEAAMRNGDYFGPTLNRAARLMSAGHGGQVLLSAAAGALAVDELPDDATLRDLGEHRLKDLGRPERVFQLVHPSLRADFPPLVTPTRQPTGLPESASPFVGRATELQRIRERLAGGSARLLTLTGPGGIGKTRLAVRAAAEEADSFEGGVFFVDLSAVREPDSVVPAIARAIGLGPAREASPLDELADWLGEQRILLVLDNFEQVAAAAPDLARLLRDCPRLSLLVTSREALRLSGEELFAVPPLSLPADPDRSPSAELAERYEAIQLFVERARAVSPGFELTNENAAAIADICVRLDGLPLAIELATARLGVFSPEALRDRLGSRLDLLRGGARDLPARQQTLRATIEWSHQLLEPGEQRLLELLSAFSDATYDAVEAVAGGLGDEIGVDPLEGLSSLVAKSLLRAVESGNGEPRLTMLETIREFAPERLGERPAFEASAHRAHALYFTDLAHRLWLELGAGGGPASATALSAEVENLRLAWRHWVAERDLEQLDLLIDGLWLVFESRGWYQAAIDAASELLDILGSSPDTPERRTRELTLRASIVRALTMIHGYTEEVEDAYVRALEPFEGERELPQLAPLLRGLALLHQFRAEFEQAGRVGAELLRLGEAQDDPGIRVDGHLVLGTVEIVRNPRAGLEHLDRAIELAEARPARSQPFRLGSNPIVAALTTSGFFLWLLGLPDTAVERARRAVALATELEHPLSLAYALFHTGLLHLWRREPELVRDRAVGVLDVAEEHGFALWGVVGGCLLGAAKTGLGRSEEGLAELREGIDLYRDRRSPPVFWPYLLQMHAGACAEAGDPSEGLALVEQALEIVDTEGRPPNPSVPVDYALKGNLLLAIPGEGAAAAEPWFRRGFEIADGLEVRMPQLQAATGLCRCAEALGDAGEATRLLTETYSVFTEGLDTPDLVEAASLLEGARQLQG